jgi:predicted secreted protein
MHSDLSTISPVQSVDHLPGPYRRALRDEHEPAAMSWFSAAIVFVVVWWLVLFMVLPFGAAPPEQVEPGMADSAPARPRLALKFLITTLIALVVSALILWIIDSGLVSLRPSV